MDVGIHMNNLNENITTSNTDRCKSILTDVSGLAVKQLNSWPRGFGFDFRCGDGYWCYTLEQGDIVYFSIRVSSHKVTVWHPRWHRESSWVIWKSYGAHLNGGPNSRCSKSLHKVLHWVGEWNGALPKLYDHHVQYNFSPIPKGATKKNVTIKNMQGYATANYCFKHLDRL